MALSDLSKFGRKLADLAKPQNYAQQVLVDWGNEIVLDFRDNLESGTPRRYASGNLAGSIAPELPQINDDGNLQLSILMAPYWDYINQGVDGILNKHGSEYSFTDPPHMKTPSGQLTFKQSIIQWIGLKGINQLSYTDESGERVTVPMDTPEHIEQGAIMIMRGVKLKGIKPSYFVDNALTTDALSDLENSIFEAIQKDLLT
tara:strand:+ start:3268 stop:3873 length:606 start_codon:yes stop_codon:yes gene_type:complete